MPFRLALVAALLLAGVPLLVATMLPAAAAPDPPSLWPAVLASALGLLATGVHLVVAYAARAIWLQEFLPAHFAPELYAELLAERVALARAADGARVLLALAAAQEEAAEASSSSTGSSTSTGSSSSSSNCSSTDRRSRTSSSSDRGHRGQAHDASPPPPPAVFVAGLPRSGTTYLFFLLAQCYGLVRKTPCRPRSWANCSLS